MIPKSSQLGAGGGKPEDPFRNLFVPGSPLGANMVPRPMVLGPFWIHLGSILDAFSGAFWDSFAGRVYKHELKRHGGGVSRQALG